MSMSTYCVVRVNQDPRDTYAAETFVEALALANPDDGDRIEYAFVEAADAGAARLARPDRWTTSVAGA
jgi:hypothetical protein